MSKKRKKVLGQKVADAMDFPASNADPMGSYTGKPIDKNEKPVQDADDL